MKLRVGSDSLLLEIGVTPVPMAVGLEPRRGGGALEETSSMLRTAGVGLVRVSFCEEPNDLDDLRPSKSAKISRLSSSRAASKDILSCC
jgi:hypothetical protein